MSNLQDYLAEIEQREQYADINDEFYHYENDEVMLDKLNRAKDVAEEFKS